MKTLKKRSLSETTGRDLKKRKAAVMPIAGSVLKARGKNNNTGFENINRLLKKASTALITEIRKNNYTDDGSTVILRAKPEESQNRDSSLRSE